MRAIFVLFDSLNRRALECYGGTVITPNFARFAKRAITFDKHYVGSLPCMPARRDILTGRLNLFHRSWGPLEPFDVTFMEVLKQQGVYSHLITDHYHYFEDGGLTYHNRYSTWEFERGQEWDPWRAMVCPPDDKFKNLYHPLQYDPPRTRSGRAQAMVNQEFVSDEQDYSLPKCFDRAFEFLEVNKEADNWILQLECFDPHEPFFSPKRFRELYPTEYEGPILNWPRYDRVDETAKEIAEIRANYAALTTMCDEYFGRLLDYFDTHDLWDDTALVVTTDHGFMLAEHDWWAKSRMPFYNEISHIPMIIHHPHLADRAGERRQSLTQNIDLMPTFLDLYGAEIPDHVDGCSLINLLESDEPVRNAAVYGQFGAATNVTDGRYTYFRYPENIAEQELFEYTLMPTHQKAMFAHEEFEGAELANSFAFLRGIPILKLPARPHPNRGQGAVVEDTETVLYDLQADPGQERPIKNPEVEKRLVDLMMKIMKRNEAPIESFTRLNLDVPASA